MSAAAIVQVQSEARVAAKPALQLGVRVIDDTVIRSPFGSMRSPFGSMRANAAAAKVMIAI